MEQPQWSARQFLLYFGLFAVLPVLKIISASPEDTYNSIKKEEDQGQHISQILSSKSKLISSSSAASQKRGLLNFPEAHKEFEKMTHMTDLSLAEIEDILPAYDRKFADFLRKLTSKNNHHHAIRQSGETPMTYKKLYLKYRNRYEKLLKSSKKQVSNVTAKRSKKMKQYAELLKKRKSLKQKYQTLWKNYEKLLNKAASPKYRPYITKYFQMKRKFIAMKKRFLVDKHKIWILKNRYNMLRGPKYPIHHHHHQHNIYMHHKLAKVCLRLIVHMQRRITGQCKRFPGSCSRCDTTREYVRKIATVRMLFPKIVICLRVIPRLG